jgi:hypothetical protein
LFFDYQISDTKIDNLIQQFFFSHFLISCRLIIYEMVKVVIASVKQTEEKDDDEEDKVETAT